MVPIVADVFKRQAKGFALAGSERRVAEINSFWIRPTGLENVQGNVFSLHNLAERIFESYVNHGVSYGLVARISHRAIDVSDARPHEILGRTHFDIGELNVRGVRMRSIRIL